LWSATSIKAAVPTGATTGNVVVTIGVTASNGKPFTVTAPSITSLSPVSGGAGTSVTITGTGFGTSQGTSTVTFNGTTATTTTPWSATSITAVVPTGATTGNVVVTVGGMASTGKAFTVTAPSITSLSPITGGAGTSVTITGTGFGTGQGTSTVKFNGTTASTFTLWSPTSIKVAVPTGATTGNIVVTVGGLASAGKPFTVTAPSITSVSPTSGAVGTSVTITGTGFGTGQGSSTVQFNGTTATTFALWSPTSIKVAAPTGATTGNVVVTVGGMASNGKSFTVKPTPSITGLSTTFGAVGISVTISGANFGTPQGTSTVKFNGVTATPTSWGASQIMVPVPSGASTGSVVVNTSGVDTNGVNFTVLTISSISVTPANLSLPFNSIQQYTATAIYSDNSTQNLGTNVTWSSSDTTITAINTTGVVTCPGQGQATIQASFGTFAGFTSVSVTGSSFFPVGSLITRRVYHTATLLANGKVLIVGGQDQNSSEIAGAELYDPATGMFTATGSLAQARMSHTATLLPGGKVLIAGGTHSTPNGLQSLSSTELYDPATGTFDSNSVPRMINDHYSHTATLLNDGRVLIAGGQYLIPNFGGGQSPAELYDPSAGTFTLTTGDLITPRSLHTATRLNDGTVLIAGGSNSYSLAGSEIYDPATNVFTASGSLATARNGHTATLLSNGKVLVAGGQDDCPSPCTNSYLSSVEIYDPAARSFLLTGSLSLARGFHSASLLNSGSPLIVGGGNFTANTGTAELFNPTNQQFTGAGSLVSQRWGHTATVLNDGTVLIAGGMDFNLVGRAEIYSATPPVPVSLRITPAGVNMLVGDTRQFMVVNNFGLPRPDATWTVDNPSLATISTDTPPILTAVAAGQVTLTATIDGVSAQTQVNISQTALPPGTVIWSAPPLPGFSALQTAQSAPSPNGPSHYFIQSSSATQQTMVQALTADGQQMWQTSLPSLNSNSIPDGFGGLLVTEHQTCNQNQTDPMSIVDVDAATGQPLWQITAASSNGGTLFCYPEAPQIAIRNDGSLVIAALGNTSGLPELMIVDGQTGAVTQIPVPTSTYTNPDQSTFHGYSRIWAPIVSSDGSTYVQYEVNVYAYPVKITSAILYLLKIAPDNSRTTTQLSSVATDTNLFPGPIIPDGQGGVVAIWTVSPSNPPMPTHPYQAAHVVNGAVAATYDLPFTRTTFPVPYGKYPTVVLGENNTIFVTDGTNTDTGPQITALDLSSGAPRWASPFPQNDTLELVVALEGGGVALKDTGSSSAQIVRFDASGNISNDGWNAAGLSPDFVSGADIWNGSPDGNSFAEVLEPFAAVPAETVWPFVRGTPSLTGSAVAFINNGIPFWGVNFLKKPSKCFLVATAPRAPLTGNALTRYNDKKQKLLTGGYLTSTACAAFFNGDPSRAQYFGSLTSAVTNQMVYDGSHSSISLYDAGGWSTADIAAYGTDTYQITSMSCQLSAGTNSIPPNGFVAVSQIQPPATDMYVNTFNYKLLTQATILHEALHNLTRLNDDQLKMLLGLNGNLGQAATDDISKKLEDNGCAGKN
jgi:IPT/TIG domain/Bacterial Ig-like domain (group 2)/Kelch motif/Galactose oxidase, central domain